jgi:hypothetical protein
MSLIYCNRHTINPTRYQHCTPNTRTHPLLLTKYVLTWKSLPLKEMTLPRKMSVGLNSRGTGESLGRSFRYLPRFRKLPPQMPVRVKYSVKELGARAYGSE